jgi:hypothetical protein
MDHNLGEFSNGETLVFSPRAAGLARRERARAVM